MLSKEVLQLLGISRPTLTKYVKTGLIRVTELPNKRYDYHAEDVFKLFNKGVERKTYLYARVSTQKQKEKLSLPIKTGFPGLVLICSATYLRNITAT